MNLVKNIGFEEGIRYRSVIIKVRTCYVQIKRLVEHRSRIRMIVLQFLDVLDASSRTGVICSKESSHVTLVILRFSTTDLSPLSVFFTDENERKNQTSS